MFRMSVLCRGAAALAAAACTNQPAVPQEARTAMPDSQLTVSLATDKPRYAPGEPITFTLTARNGGSQPVTLHFSSGQRYDFTFDDAGGRTVWRWSADKAFIQVLGDETLTAGGALVYRERFEERLVPGMYRITGMVTAMGGALRATATVAVGP